MITATRIVGLGALLAIAAWSPPGCATSSTRPPGTRSDLEAVACVAGNENLTLEDLTAHLWLDYGSVRLLERHDVRVAGRPALRSVGRAGDAAVDTVVAVDSACVYASTLFLRTAEPPTTSSARAIEGMRFGPCNCREP